MAIRRRGSLSSLLLRSVHLVPETLWLSVYTYTRVNIASYTVLCGFPRARVRHIVIQLSTIITGRQQMHVFSFLLHASNLAKAFYEHSRTCHYESLVCLFFYFLFFFFVFFFLLLHSWMNSRTRFSWERSISLRFF